MMYYEIELSGDRFIKFVSEVKKQMFISGMTNKDLAKRLNVSTSSINRFFCKTAPTSKYLAALIANELEMKGW